MLKKTLLLILLTLSLISYYLTYQQGNNLELIVYQTISNWYFASILGRAIPGLIIFSFIYLLLPHKSLIFKSIFFTSIIIFIVVSIQLNLESTLTPNNLLKTKIQYLLPIFTIILSIKNFGFKTKAKTTKKWLIILIVSTGAITFSFISTPLFIEDFQNISDIDIITKDKTISNSKSKNLIIYASTSCPHCYRAILKTYLTLKNKATKNSIIIKFVEDKKRVEAYFEYLNVNFEFEIISKNDFIKENGYSFPSFFLLNKKNKIINYWKAENYNYYTLQKLNKSITLSNK